MYLICSLNLLAQGETSEKNVPSLVKTKRKLHKTIDLAQKTIYELIKVNWASFFLSQVQVSEKNSLRKVAPEEKTNTRLLKNHQFCSYKVQ